MEAVAMVGSKACVGGVLLLGVLLGAALPAAQSWVAPTSESGEDPPNGRSPAMEVRPMEVRSVKVRPVEVHDVALASFDPPAPFPLAMLGAGVGVLAVIRWGRPVGMRRRSRDATAGCDLRDVRSPLTGQGRAAIAARPACSETRDYGQGGN